MTELTQEHRKTPKPPSLLHVVACLLELAIVATFFGEQSIVGLALCVGYSFFSATWALFRSDESE